VFAYLVVVATRGHEVEPTVAVSPALYRGHLFEIRLCQFGVGTVDVVNPKARYRARHQQIVLDRIGAEKLEPITVLGHQPGESGHVGLDFHSKPIGKKGGHCLPIFNTGPYPDDSFDVHCLVTPLAWEPRQRVGSRFPRTSTMPIENIQDLHEHLRLALRIELATVPPYLYAMYSIADPGSDSALLIRSIVTEEMLHAALVANILLAVGGEPDFDNDDLITVYPISLPHHTPPLVLGLRPCSPQLIREVFMALEQPEVEGRSTDPDQFLTLGQFYHALEHGLAHLDSSMDLFADPQRPSQLSDPSFYTAVEFDDDDSGGLLEVVDLESATAAIEVIVHQGEGVRSEHWADPEHRELTHYYKLLQIAEEQSPIGLVRNLAEDPVTADYPGNLRSVSNLFNASYRYLFRILANLYLPHDEKGSHVGSLYLMMGSVMSPLARYLTEQPIGGGRFAGPTFELYRFLSRPEQELAGLAELAVAEHPDLAPTLRAIRSLTDQP